MFTLIMAPSLRERSYNPKEGWEDDKPPPCMGAFVSELLKGYLGALQMQAPVARRPKASCSPFDQAGKYEGEPPLSGCQCTPGLLLAEVAVHLW